MIKIHAAVYIKSISHSSMSALGGDPGRQWLTVMVSSIGHVSSGAAISITHSAHSTTSQAIGLIGAGGCGVSSVGDVEYECTIGRVG